jgi:hypothetical protein
MSLVAIAKCSVIAALGATQFAVNYMTTSEQSLVANKHLSKSDAMYHQGDVKGAVDEFYSAFAPTAEKDEKEVVTEYLNKLIGKDAIAVDEQKDVISVEEMHCRVFSMCQKGEEGMSVDKRDSIRGGSQGRISKRALNWTFHAEHQIASKFVKELAHAFAINRWGRYLEGKGSRAYCYSGACLSWHVGILPWASSTAKAIVDDVLTASHGSVLISARAAAKAPVAGAQAFCVSNRPTGC